MKLLFVCNQNKHRSKTAEQLFANKFETKSAGLYNDKPLTTKQLSWADVVVVMEDSQRSEIAKRFPREYMQKRIVSLNVPYIYKEVQEALKKVLKINIRSCF